MTEGAEPYEVKASRTVLNGEREETCRKVTRLALTHRGANTLPKGQGPNLETQMKEEWRKGRSSLKTGKPSTRWRKGVKESPNGEGP
jgi:Reverse transcriptase (RNA-dependent DNA polymerase)